MQRIIIIALIFIIIGAFMAVETIRFNEQAVKTTFGKADASSVINTPGTHWKIPWIQKYTKYDSRVRFIQSNMETKLTLDKSQLLGSRSSHGRLGPAEVLPDLRQRRRLDPRSLSGRGRDLEGQAPHRRRGDLAVQRQRPALGQGIHLAHPGSRGCDAAVAQVGARRARRP